VDSLSYREASASFLYASRLVWLGVAWHENKRNKQIEKKIQFGDDDLSTTCKSSKEAEKLIGQHGPAMQRFDVEGQRS